MAQHDQAQERSTHRQVDIQLNEDGSLTADGNFFNSWNEYFNSDFFRQRELRCGTLTPPDAQGVPPQGDDGIAGGSQFDCTFNCTNPLAIYAPSVVRYRIPVVVHVIQNTSGQGFLSNAQVQSQIVILNEDFLALAGSNGANGLDVQIEFALATTDPNGNPTDGIMNYTNNTWFNDQGSYWNSIAWDPTNYLNIYTNTASGNLGYVPFLPQQGGAGSAADRVVVHYTAFGDNSSGGPPYNQGRTTTHEVGHYLGLFHTFQDGCGVVASGPCSGSNCHTTGDRCCDVNAHSGPQFGCPTNSTCGDGTDPHHNYMNYTDDLCMWEFEDEQARRMRCTLEHWRPALYEIVVLEPPNNNCAQATLCFDGNTPFTTVNATTDGPTEAACLSGGNNHITNDVWYKWVATCNGNATISLCGASYNSKLGIYSACPSASGTVIACNDNFCGDDASVTFPVTTNTLYRIRVGGFNNATGTGTMSIACTPASCTGDANNSGAVNVDDLLMVINSWGPCAGCPADFDGNNVVNVDDLLTVINNWGPC